MEESENAVGIIVAAGKGERMSGPVRKQYRFLGPFPMLVHSLFAFEQSRLINSIILVVDPSDLEFCRTQILGPYQFQKTVQITPGGETRQRSVYNGLKLVTKNCDIVVVHDGARPLVSQFVIDKSVEIAREFGACIVAVPAHDTIKLVEDHFVQTTLPRNQVWIAQTPQTFKRGLIIEAHERALKEGVKGTDDAALIERLGFKVRVLQGDYRNIKITTLSDLKVADAFLNMGESRLVL
ncbi:MAG: 2-C-methyl-D-erythritol 4-phosphate cytidylyltransferase [Pseudomonadota bacterium]